MSLLQYVLRRQQDLFALCEQIQTIYRGQVREQKISDNCNLKKSSEMRLTSDTVWPDLVSTSCLHFTHLLDLLHDSDIPSDHL